jgi:hypothetical protein
MLKIYTLLYAFIFLLTLLIFLDLKAKKRLILYIKILFKFFWYFRILSTIIITICFIMLPNVKMFMYILNNNCGIIKLSSF